jgi:hypothetical protein
MSLEERSRERQHMLLLSAFGNRAPYHEERRRLIGLGRLATDGSDYLAPGPA